MRTFDLSPLFSTTVGFDRMARMLDQMSSESAPSYPPYNIERTDEDAYRVTMAVAGFGEEDIAVEVKENVLTVSGNVGKEEEKGKAYLHRGIATRAFERRFSLADHIQVTGAALENGLLHIDLVREVPEALKPRRISIATDGQKKLTQKAA